MTPARCSSSLSTRAALVLGMFATVLSGCASGELAATDGAKPPRALYRPGQSLDARLCECRECMERACCDGEPEEREPAAETELGMFVAACGRCVRRTWTVRGSTTCDERAPSECCEGSVSN